MYNTNNIKIQILTYGIHKIVSNLVFIIQYFLLNGFLNFVFLSFVFEELNILVFELSLSQWAAVRPKKIKTKMKTKMKMETEM